MSSTTPSQTPPTTPNPAAAPSSGIPNILLSQNSTSAAESLSKSVNWLLYGNFGTGKTHAAATARQPIYFQSFDPAGAEIPHIQALVADGRAIINRECEHESLEKPTAFAAFDKNFQLLLKSGAFNHIGTYVIDSLTFFSDAAMNQALKERGRAGGKPEFDDYSRVKQLFKKTLDVCCNLPCDFILTAHIKVEKDEAAMTTYTSVSAIGHNATLIPAYFSEVYVTSVLKTANGIERKLLTSPNQRYDARTRIGSGKFSQYEIPDLMELRKKAGIGVDHLPPLR